jgi:hypothetical protein
MDDQKSGDLASIGVTQKKAPINDIQSNLSALVSGRTAGALVGLVLRGRKTVYRNFFLKGFFH